MPTADMTRAELIALAERVEAAQGADRELDRLVQEARGVCTHRRFTRYVCQDDSGFVCDACGEDLYGNRSWPRFTSSLDAAASLVLADHWWEVGRDSSNTSPLKHFGPRAGHCFKAGVGRWGGTPRYVWAATPALALTAAALRAMAEEAPE